MPAAPASCSGAADTIGFGAEGAHVADTKPEIASVRSVVATLDAAAIWPWLHAGASVVDGLPEFVGRYLDAVLGENPSYSLA